MKRRIILPVLILVFLVLTLSVQVFAATETGTCGDSLTWQLTDAGVLTISGEGEMYDYQDQDPPWRWKKFKTIKVEDGVTSIGDFAFDPCSQVTSVILADSVTSIGRYAFSNCSITEIDLPDNLETIEDHAFITTKLTNIKLPSKLKTIGGSAFCSSPLETITIPASVTFIGNEQGSPFSGIKTLTEIKVASGNKYYCSVDGVLFNKDKTELIQYPLGKSGTSYTIPSSVDKIGDDAFRAVKLKEITIPKGVKEIGWGAFHYAHKLKEVAIPSTAKSIDPSAFNVCYALQKFTVSSDNKYYSAKDGVLFNKDKTELIFYPAGKTTLEYTVPNTVEYINGGAFKGNESLYTLTLSKNLKEMGGYIVEGCDNLTAIIFKGDAPKTVSYPDYPFSWDGNRVFYPANNKTWTEDVVAAFEENNGMWPYDPKMDPPKITAGNNYTTGRIKLTWNAVEGAKSYWIFKSTSKYGRYTYIGSVNKTSYTDTSNFVDFDGPPDPGEKYYYKIEAVKEDGVRSLTSEPVARTCNLPRTEVKAKNTASSGKVKLTWSKVSGAEEYTVYRSTKKDGTYEAIKTTTSTSFTDSTGKVGTRYYYKVVAVHSKSAANSAKSVAVARTRDLKQLSVEESNVASSGKIKLEWTAVTGAEKYAVYRSLSKDSGFEKIASTESASYTDKSAKAGTVYYYKVKAVHQNTDANSAYSAVVGQTCDLKRPDISVKLSSGNPKLSWEAISGATKYYIYRATVKNGAYEKIDSTTKTSYTDKSAEEGKTYYYKVKAVHENSNANSAYSSIVSIKTK